MRDARTLIEGLLGSGAAGKGGVPEILQKARGAWDGQSTLGKGAIAGGLVGLLLGGNGARLAGTAVRTGGMALVGAMAYQAWQDWQAGRSPGATHPAALPEPGGTAFLPDDESRADDLSERLLQAMVAAAKADGRVTPDERNRIDRHLAELGLGAEAKALIAAELDSPLDAGRIAGLARSPEEATEIYTVSLLAVDPEGAAEKGYLAMLAARLGLDPGLVAHLHAQTKAIA